MSVPSNVPSTIGLPSGAPQDIRTVALYLSQAVQALLSWISLAATRINVTVTWTTVPPTAGSAGAPGQLASDGTYLYVCTATNTWKRVAVSTF